MKEARCRICCGLLFETASVDASGRMRLMTEGIDIQYDDYGSSYHIRCSQCEAKNIAMKREVPGTAPELDVVAAVVEEND